MLYSNLLDYKFVYICIGAVLDMPEVKRFVGKPNLITFTKHWYCVCTRSLRKKNDTVAL